MEQRMAIIVPTIIIWLITPWIAIYDGTLEILSDKQKATIIALTIVDSNFTSECAVKTEEATLIDDLLWYLFAVLNDED